MRCDTMLVIILVVKQKLSGINPFINMDIITIINSCLSNLQSSPVLPSRCNGATEQRSNDAGEGRT